eukprot:TRINITY_DN9380_c0_g1_i1.p1 TRINITY_DN9380_c0_g1~~TRINITY_DN9380_c0_g1_i1.p1  ORF type:complete len:678 (+),score=90.00 TRINITY_DN9380_c0_g1_i1:266-2035(+)
MVASLGGFDSIEHNEYRLGNEVAFASVAEFLDWHRSEGDRFLNSQIEALSRFIMSQEEMYEKNRADVARLEGEVLRMRASFAIERMLAGEVTDDDDSLKKTSVESPEVVESVDRVGCVAVISRDDENELELSDESTSTLDPNERPTEQPLSGSLKVDQLSSCVKPVSILACTVAALDEPPRQPVKSLKEDPAPSDEAGKLLGDCMVSSRSLPGAPLSNGCVSGVIGRYHDEIDVPSDKMISDIQSRTDSEELKRSTSMRTNSIRRSRSTRSLMSRPSSAPAGRKSRSVFPTEDEMKEKVRMACCRDTNVSRFYEESSRVSSVVLHPWFESCSTGVILFNALWVAMDIDYNRATSLVESDWYFQAIEHLLCSYFLFEWILRFAAFENKANCLFDKWMIFDFVLMMAFVLETWIISVFLHLTGLNQSLPGMKDISVTRLFRRARLSRLARFAKLLRLFPELQLLTKGVMIASQVVFFTFGFLICVIYIFAITFTQMLRGSKVGGEYFESVWSSMVSLALYGTLGENLPDVAIVVSEESWACGLILLVFVVFASLTVMNLLIGFSSRSSAWSLPRRRRRYLPGPQLVCPLVE